MSTPLLLVDELCTIAEAATADLLLENENNSLSAAQIVAGFLDEDIPTTGKPSEPSTLAPFVIVRFLSAKDMLGQSTATVKFIAMTYSKRGQGWRDAVELLIRIRMALLRNQTVGKRFRLEHPIEWEMPEDRPWPYSVAWMTTTWTIAQPIEEIDYDQSLGGIYGEKY